MMLVMTKLRLMNERLMVGSFMVFDHSIDAVPRGVHLTQPVIKRRPANPGSAAMDVKGYQVEANSSQVLLNCLETHFCV